MNTKKHDIDLLIAWVWEFDHDFVLKLQENSLKEGLRFEHITVYDVSSFTRKILSGELSVSCFMDRASDVDENFSPLKLWAIESGTDVINTYQATELAINKAYMQSRLENLEIQTPKTIVVPAYDELFHLPQHFADQISGLSKPFVAKPSSGGGGEGVEKAVWSYDEFLRLRQAFAWDAYLVQEKIYPAYHSDQRFWFRAYYIYGHTEVVFWNDETFIYQELTGDQKSAFNLSVIENRMHAIARATNMDFFSSEFALTQNNEFVIIDYVNDQVDMRPQSRHHDGVPDRIVDQVIHRTIAYAKNARHNTGRC